MAQALTLALTRPALPAPLEALRVVLVCGCALVLAGAKFAI